MLDILVIDQTDGCEETVPAVREFGYEGIIIYFSRSDDIKFLQQAFPAGAYNFAKKNETDRFQTVLRNALNTASRTRHPKDGFYCSWDIYTDQLAN